MACGCTTYICKEVFVNPCTVGTSTGIEAAETGNYTFRVEFNGMVSIFSVAALSGEDIVIPTSALNESYTHEATVIAPSGATVCYWLNTMISMSIAYVPFVPVDNDTWQPHTVVVDEFTNTVTSPYFSGDVADMIWINEQPVQWAVNGVSLGVITKTGDTFDFSAFGGISGKIFFNYKNLI